MYYHCVTYFNEKELLKILCEEIKMVGDYEIVLVEATSTHTGDPKPLYFDQIKKEFESHPIRHIIVDDLPNDGDPWHNENYQRDCIMRGLQDLKSNDVVFIGDLDEIPRWQAVQFYEPRMGVASLQMDKYSCYINLLEGIQNWGIAKITTWGNLKKTTPNKLRNGGSDFTIYFGGWHMSFLGGVEKMREKLFAYAHSETVTNDLLENLERKYEIGESLWGRDRWSFVKIDKTFPQYLQDNQEEFKHLIKEV